jgi:long-chain acyl-CoA synthetase
VVLAPGPFSHSTAVYALADSLHAGAHVVLARGFQARTILRTIRERGVSVLYAVPTHLRLLIEAAEAGENAAVGVRLILSGGAKWPAELAARCRAAFPNALFAEFYGASELSFVALARSDEDVPDGSVGRAFPGVAITVRDRVGRRLPTGRTGLVFAESALTFGGYAMDGGEVRRVGNALSVGDRGFLDDRGFLHLRGRVDRMVIVSGRNVQPETVEAALAEHPAIAEAAVIGVPDERRGAALLALVVLRDGTSVSRQELIRRLRATLPPHLVPRRFACPPSWPRTRSSKADLPALSRLWATGQCAVLS